MNQFLNPASGSVKKKRNGRPLENREPDRRVEADSERRDGIMRQI